LAVKLLCGAVAGITGTCIIYPLDIVKTRLQNQAKGTAAPGSVVYKGGIDCFRTIVRTEGVKGLYRGLPANLVGITPEKAIKLAVNDYAREHFADRINAKRLYDARNSGVSSMKRISADDIPIPQGMAAGAIAGFCQVVATNPMEIVKINTQMQIGKSAKGSWEIAKELGLRGVYKGTAATLLRDVPFSFIFFPLSTVAKRYLHERDVKNGWTGKPKFQSVFLGGVAAGIVAAVAVTPADGKSFETEIIFKSSKRDFRQNVKMAFNIVE
jgi:hypothetical protein